MIDIDNKHRKYNQMSTSEIIESVRSSFAMEGMKITAEDERIGQMIIENKISIEEVIENIKKRSILLNN